MLTTTQFATFIAAATYPAFFPTAAQVLACAPGAQSFTVRAECSPISHPFDNQAAKGWSHIMVLDAAGVAVVAVYSQAEACWYVERHLWL